MRLELSRQTDGRRAVFAPRPGGPGTRTEQRNLRRALKDNRPVNTALGVLMGYLRLSEQQAFDTLMAYTTARNLKTFDVSTRIVAAINALSAEAGTGHVAAEAQLFLDEFRAGPLKGDS